MKQLRHALAYRGAHGTASARALMARFGQASGHAIGPMLRGAGPFIAARDAYAFKNGGPGWPITLEDARTLRQHYEPALDKVVLLGIEIARKALSGVELSLIGGATLSLPAAAVDFVIGRISQPLRNKLVEAIAASVPGTFGRCGGMAFSGLDFFLAGWPVDTSVTKPGSGELRQYIWRRLLDSLDKNALSFLEWMMILQILPVISRLASAALGSAAGSIGGPVGAAIGAFVGGREDVLGLGGADALRDKSREHLRRLGQRLAGAAAWPIGLVYEGKINPTDQHQVLAIGINDGGAGTLTLDIWDNNDGAFCRKLQIDLRGAELMVSSTNPKLNAIKGIICEDYEPQTPPEALRRANAFAPATWSVSTCA